MNEDELAEALAEYKKAIEEEVRLNSECQKARSEDPALAQAKKDIEELDKERRKAGETWDYFNNKFNKEHEQLLESLDSAWRYRREVEKLIAGIINKMIGANND